MADGGRVDLMNCDKVYISFPDLCGFVYDYVGGVVKVMSQARTCQ